MTTTVVAINVMCVGCIRSLGRNKSKEGGRRRTKKERNVANKGKGQIGRLKKEGNRDYNLFKKCSKILLYFSCLLLRPSRSSLLGALPRLTGGLFPGEQLVKSIVPGLLSVTRQKSKFYSYNLLKSVNYSLPYGNLCAPMTLNINDPLNNSCPAPPPPAETLSASSQLPCSRALSPC
jgi:hypothetical protein